MCPQNGKYGGVMKTSVKTDGDSVHSVDGRPPRSTIDQLENLSLDVDQLENLSLVGIYTKQTSEQT